MLLNNTEYINILSDVKDRIKSAQYKVVLGANKEIKTTNSFIQKTFSYLSSFFREVPYIFCKIIGCVAFPI